MNKPVINCLLLAVLCLLLTALLPADQRAAQQAERLWEELADLQDWPVAPGTHTLMPGQAPHGRFVTIHTNELAFSGLSNDLQAMPVGAILAKENFDSNRVLENITVMHKTADGWFWALYGAEGSVLESGDIDSCISCHAGAPRDMVFVWQKNRSY